MQVQVLCCLIMTFSRLFCLSCRLDALTWLSENPPWMSKAVHARFSVSQNGQAPVVQAICLRECRKCFAIDISNLCPPECDPNAALGGDPGRIGHFGTHGEGPTQVTKGPCGVHGLNHAIST